VSPNPFFVKINALLLPDEKSNGAPRVKIKTKIKERVTPHPLL
jgi:hypothetical protein